MIKLIVLDMDGTLMSADHVTVSEENKAALRAAHNSGAKISIATGRTLSIIGTVCEQLPEIDYIIYSNGAGIYDRNAGKTIYEKPLECETSINLIDYLDKQPAFIEVYSEGQSYIQPDKLKFFPTDFIPKVFVDELLKGMENTDSLTQLVRNKPCEKYTIYIPDKDKRSEIYDYLSKIKNIDLTSSMAIGMEFTACNITKGTALKEMCHLLNIDLSECMTFGDAANDIPMIEIAGYGIAMGNATEDTKQAAKFVTKPNTEDGVAFAVRKYMEPEE